METAIEVYRANQLAWVLALGVLTCAFFYYCWKEEEFQWWNLIPRRRGRAMQRARRNFIRADATYAFVSYVMDQVYHENYTPKEASELYRDMKKCFPIKEMFPSPALLKDAINRRRASGINDPMPFPDKKEKARPKKIMFPKLAVK